MSSGLSVKHPQIKITSVSLSQPSPRLSTQVTDTHNKESLMVFLEMLYSLDNQLILP